MVDKLLVILKFVLAVLLLPLIIATVAALQGELAKLDPLLEQAIHVGALAYVLMKFFVYDFDPIYKFGQGLVAGCFQFLKPVMDFAPYVFPVYTIIGIILYTVANATGNMGEHGSWGPVFFTVIAFTFAMHIVLTAQDLYVKDSMAGKPDYFFAIEIIFIVDVFFMAMLMSLAGKGFSFVNFFKALSGASCDIYMGLFRQLFLR